MENFSMIDFNYFDISIAAVVLLLSLKGFMHGFIKEVFALVGLIGGVYFASRLSDAAAIFIDKNFLHLENTALLKLIGFLAILLIIWLGATILGSIFAKLTSNDVGIFSRIFGFITAVGKYFLIFALIITALSNVSLVKDNIEKHIKDSILYPYLKKAGSKLINHNQTTSATQDTNNSTIPATSFSEKNVTIQSTL